MTLLGLAVPGDLFGTITAIANAVSTGNQAIISLAQDQSPEGRRAVAAINTLFQPLINLLNKLEGHVTTVPSSNPPATGG